MKVRPEGASQVIRVQGHPPENFEIVGCQRCDSRHFRGGIKGLTENDHKIRLLITAVFA